MNLVAPSQLKVLGGCDTSGQLWVVPASLPRDRFTLAAGEWGVWGGARAGCHLLCHVCRVSRVPTHSQPSAPFEQCFRQVPTCLLKLKQLKHLPLA